jgi:hypothetical protein
MNVDAAGWYAVSIGGLTVLLIVARPIYLALLRRDRRIQNLWEAGTFTIRDIRYCMQSTRKFPLFGLATTFEALVIASLIAGNGVFLAYSHREPKGLGRGSAVGAVVNLMPVFFGGRTFPLAYLGVSLRFYYVIHGCLATMAATQAVLHWWLYAGSDYTTVVGVSGVIVRDFRLGLSTSLLTITGLRVSCADSGHIVGYTDSSNQADPPGAGRHRHHCGHMPHRCCYAIARSGCFVSFARDLGRNARHSYVRITVAR